MAQSVAYIDPEAISDDGPVCPRATQIDRAHFRAEGLDQELAEISPLQWLFSSTLPPSQQRADVLPPSGRLSARREHFMAWPRQSLGFCIESPLRKRLSNLV